MDIRLRRQALLSDVKSPSTIHLSNPINSNGSLYCSRHHSPSIGYSHTPNWPYLRPFTVASLFFSLFFLNLIFPSLLSFYYIFKSCLPIGFLFLIIFNFLFLAPSRHYFSSSLLFIVTFFHVSLNIGLSDELNFKQSLMRTIYDSTKYEKSNNNDCLTNP